MAKELSQILKDLVKSSDEVYAKICEVVTVDLGQKTCVLKPIDGTAEITEVFLSADIDTGVFYEPVIKSLVCVVFITKTMGVVVSYSELKAFTVTVGNTEMIIDDSGLKLTRQGQSLKDVLNEFMDNVINGTVITSMGASPFTPPTITLLNQSKVKINQILN